MVRRLAIVAAALAAALAVGSAVYALSGDDPEGTSAAQPELVTSCNGGAQKAVLVRTRDTEQTLATEGVDTPVADMTINRFVPAGDADTFVVSFSSQTELNGAGTDDSIEVQVLADGVAMAPVGSVSFAGTAQRESHAAAFCRRLSGGASGTTYTFTVTWRLFDAGANNSLTGILDDTTLHVEVSN
jgi:hypothetical protein